MAGWGAVVPAVVAVWVEPFAWLAALTVLFRYLAQVRVERRLHGVRMHRASIRWGVSLVLGMAGGFVASTVLWVLGLAGEGPGMAWAAAVTLVLGWVRSRWMTFAYGAGVVGLASLAARWFPQGWIPTGWAEFWAGLIHLDVPSMLGAAGVFGVVEGLLVAVIGHLWAVPAPLPGRRGGAVGGYLLQQFWVMPAVTTASFLSWPAGAILPGGLAPVPIPVGFETAAVARLPRERALASAGMIALFGCILLALAWVARERSALAWAAALFAPVAREWISLWSFRREWSGSPRFAQGPGGIRILAVVAGSPAAALGLRPGDTVTEVNGREVHSLTSLYEAIRSQPAFVRMEVRDPAGDVRICSRSRYEGEPHLLGVVAAPGEGEEVEAQVLTVLGRSFSILRGFLRGRPTRKEPVRGER
ncbi:MAG: PDZ domain-containing protein [Kyrpidia tusciae]|nr:PDZ domain-containing protein [Kyrpidia tusciae]MBE3552227.1 PDZ domain-containing protein [Kyrpidia tusciae]